MPTNPNMVAIQTVTVGSGGASSISFTSIPATYTDLVVMLSTRLTGNAGGMYLTFNGSSSSYSGKRLGASGASTVYSDSNAGLTDKLFVRAEDTRATASTFASTQIYVPNYASSNNKSVSYESVAEDNGTTYNGIELNAGLWSNSAAITTVTVVPEAGNFAQYSTATLYGVTSAGYGAKATGGIITSDANYYYHTFLASGTFTPTQSITADCLVIAGGGAGGHSYAAGGGAGGLLGYTSQSLSATGYTVTVGAGAAGTATAGSGADGSNSQFGSLTASVGGGGGGGNLNGNGRTGGSGGGGARDTGTGGAATSGQGYAGTNASSGNYAGGGGGAGGTSASGVGGVGSSAFSSYGSATGAGQNVSGTYYFAGGGAGYPATGAETAGGSGGGGRTGPGGVINATANTGGGGGAWNGSAATSGNGGSGIVIVRYAK
jgi:hypothetical protein